MLNILYHVRYSVKPLLVFVTYCLLTYKLPAWYYFVNETAQSIQRGVSYAAD